MKEGSYHRRKLISRSSKDHGIITSIMPGDFNGDSFMDVLVTRKDQNPGITVQIYWSDVTKIGIKSNSVLPDKFADEPLLME